MMSYVANPEARRGIPRAEVTHAFGAAKATAVRAFHAAFPEYESTPLLRLRGLARTLDVDEIWVKDESHRLGLDAFKVLGASHGVAHALAVFLRSDPVSFDRLRAQDLRDVTLVTATDGNHGHAVAWAAARLGCNAIVYLPSSASTRRAAAIETLGARVVVIDGNYDDAVAVAAKSSERAGVVLVQDTSWPSYEEIPLRIMEGYLTLLQESIEQLDGAMPSHIFLQCGAGSFAAALQAHAYELWGDDRPLTVVVESSQAASFFASVQAGGRERKKIAGEHKTIMSGLACGEPSLLAWEILRRFGDVFVSCDDILAVEGMTLLRNPIASDAAIRSGPSGAVTTGLLAAARRSAAASDTLRLDRQSRVLLISTEGDRA